MKIKYFSYAKKIKCFCIFSKNVFEKLWHFFKNCGSNRPQDSVLGLIIDQSILIIFSVLKTGQSSLIVQCSESIHFIYIEEFNDTDYNMNTLRGRGSPLPQ